MWKTWVQSLGWEDPLEKGKVTHSSILAWRIPWGRKEYSGLENFHGVAESQTWLSDFHFTSFTCNMFRLCPWWCTYQHFIGFYCSVTLHCKDISHFICSFIFWWTFGLCLCCCLVAELCLNLLRLHWLEPVRLLCLWDFPGKNTRVRLPFPSPGDLTNPGIKPTSPG